MVRLWALGAEACWRLLDALLMLSATPAHHSHGQSNELPPGPGFCESSSQEDACSLTCTAAAIKYSFIWPSSRGHMRQQRSMLATAAKCYHATDRPTFSTAKSLTSASSRCSCSFAFKWARTSGGSALPSRRSSKSRPIEATSLSSDQGPTSSVRSKQASSAEGETGPAGPWSRTILKHGTEDQQVLGAGPYWNMEQRTSRSLEWDHTETWNRGLKACRLTSAPRQRCELQADLEGSKASKAGLKDLSVLNSRCTMVQWNTKYMDWFRRTFTSTFS